MKEKGAGSGLEQLWLTDTYGKNRLFVSVPSNYIDGLLSKSHITNPELDLHYWRPTGFPAEQVQVAFAIYPFIGYVTPTVEEK